MSITNIQCDALRELGNIGAAHAATTLSQMLTCNIEMNVPEIHLVDLSDVHTHIGDEVSALVIFEIQGEVGNGGFVVLHLPKSSALRMTNLLLGSQEVEREFNDMDRSALLEIGNIMVSAFLDGTAGLLNIVMLPSPPCLAFDMPHAAIQTILAQQEVECNEVVLFRTELHSSELMVSANLLLLPNPPMLQTILKILERLTVPNT